MTSEEEAEKFWSERWEATQRDLESACAKLAQAHAELEESRALAEAYFLQGKVRLEAAEAELAQARAENARLREVLEWFGNPPTTDEHAWKKARDRARALLNDGEP
jgi:hypothetical protein